MNRKNRGKNFRVEGIKLRGRRRMREGRIKKNEEGKERKEKKEEKKIGKKSSEGKGKLMNKGKGRKEKVRGKGEVDERIFRKGNGRDA